jgi:hypothetical protein
MGCDAVSLNISGITSISARIVYARTGRVL